MSQPVTGRFDGTGVGFGAGAGDVDPGLGDALGEPPGDILGVGLPAGDGLADGLADGDGDPDEDAVAGHVPVSSNVVASVPDEAETVAVALISTAPAGSPTNACLSVGGPKGPVLVTLFVPLLVENVTVIETKDVLSWRRTK